MWRKLDVFPGIGTGHGRWEESGDKIGLSTIGRKSSLHGFGSSNGEMNAQAVDRIQLNAHSGNLVPDGLCHRSATICLDRTHVISGLAEV